MADSVEEEGFRWTIIKVGGEEEEPPAGALSGFDWAIGGELGLDVDLELSHGETFEAVEWAMPTVDSVELVADPAATMQPAVEPPTSAERLARGQRLGEHIEILRQIDAGGMGEVFLARDVALGRKVAVKALRAAVVGSAEEQEHRIRLFRRDAAATARLQHPNIVTIFQIGVEQGAPYMVLEFLRGESLGARLRRGALRVAEALVVMEQIAAALVHAHAAGVTHRDLKPANIFLRHDGIVKVLDFGVALLHADRDEMIEAFQRSPEELEAYLGSSPTSAGTPLYMAPEQLRGLEQDARVDLWACGVVLYEMLTGARPFRTPMHAIMGVMSGVMSGGATGIGEGPPSVRELLPDAPPELDALIQRCLAVDLDARVPSAEALREEILALLDGPRGLRAAMLRADAPPTNLGMEQDSFIGRGRELRRLEALWAGGERLLLLGGAGGTGKTRLARQFGANLLERFAGGVWFCDLQEARSEADVLFAVARVLGVPLTELKPDSPGARALLGAALRGRGAALLILDNLEQVLDPMRAILPDWLDAAPGATFLCTSRTRLGVSDEVLLRLAPLGLPDDEAEDVTSIARAEAVALFVERARKARPSFALDDTSAREVAELVRLLDGLPLAIELAAARVRMLTPAKMLARLSRRFELLRDRTAKTSRQATLRGTLDWSWELLDEAERATLAQLAVFEGGFEVDALEAVVDLDGFDGEPWAFDMLESLLDKHLVRPLPEQDEQDEPRFDLLVSIHMYAREKLESTRGVTCVGVPWSGGGATERAESAHAEWYAQLGGVDVLDAAFVRDRMEIYRLTRERKNLRAAFQRAVARGWDVLAAELACALCFLYEHSGPYSAGLDTLAQLSMDALEPELRVRLTIQHARFLWRTGEVERAVSLLDGVAGQAQTAELRARLAIMRGLLASERGLIELADQHLGEARDVAERADLTCLHGVALGNLAISIQQQGELDEALSMFSHALELQRSIGELKQESVLLANLGVLQFQRGDLEASGRALRRSLALSRELGDRRTEGALRSNLSVLLREQGDHQEALTHLNRSLEIARELGARRTEGIALGNLANVHRVLGEHERARRGLERALSVASDLGDARWCGYWLGVLADLAEELGQLDEARGYLERALAHLEEVEDRFRTGVTHCRIGRIACRSGDRDGAARALAQAASLAEDMGVLPDSELGKGISALRALMRGEEV